MLHELFIKTKERNAFVNITSQVAKLVKDVNEGVVTLFVPHTTAGVTINENADPDVQSDLLGKLAELIPQEDDYDHAEGNSDAHLKASLMGSSVSVIIQDGKLKLGTWQGIYFCEFDGPRRRKVYVRY